MARSRRRKGSVDRVWAVLHWARSGRGQEPWAHREGPRLRQQAYL